jgi:hypothetical protein
MISHAHLTIKSLMVRFLYLLKVGRRMHAAVTYGRLRGMYSPFHTKRPYSRVALVGLPWKCWRLQMNQESSA